MRASNSPGLAPIARLDEIADVTYRELRERCAASGYDDELVMSMSSLALSASGAEFLPLVQHVLRRRGDSASTLARLFAYSDAVADSELHAVLGKRLTEALLSAGVLATGADGYVSNFHLRPLDGLWLFADDPGAGRDAVMPPAGTTRQIVLLMPDAIDAEALDVGCGPGSLALVAAKRGARHVVGTDINPRAVALARFNARLNGLSQKAEFLVGDLVEPVRGQRFPLIVAQPPYVVQPAGTEAVTYLHGGPSGEELSRRLLAQLPDVLTPGGRALVLMEAVVRPDEPLHARLKPLLGNAAVDLLVLAAPGPPPSVQVLAYATLEAPHGGQPYRAAAQRYLDHLEALGATDFHHALVVLRAHPEGATGRARLAATVPVKALAHGDANALESLLGSIDMAALQDTRLTAERVRVAACAQWLEERPGPDTTAEPRHSVRFGAGSFGNDCYLTPDRYQMAALLNSAPSIGAAAGQLARATGRSGASAHAEILAFAREGLMRGLLQQSRS
jgi:SAM-dependent methyltransferase